MKNIFQTYGDDGQVIHDWIKMKYKEKFNQDIDLSKEVLITYADKAYISLTPETSETDEESSLYINVLVNQLNTSSPTLEEMKYDIAEYFREK